MELETAVYVTGGVLGGACAVLLVIAVILCVQVSALKKDLQEMRSTRGIRVQKLQMEPDKNHAYHNPTLTPDEELSKRGYTMYVGNEREVDVESGRGTERQTGGQFLEELSREIDHRQQRDSTTAPKFLLNSIEENKRRSRSLNNPVASNGRASDTNPNFIY